MRVLVVVAALGMTAAGSAAAQRTGATPPQGQERPCEMIVDTVRRYAQRGQTYFGGGGVFMHCENDPRTTVRSDSMAWFPQSGELQLFGRVEFRDSASTLDADRVIYWTQQERLYATGNVYTRSLTNGSDLRGPNLDYYRAAPNIRDTIEIRATGRPTINFYPKRDTTEADTARPFVIVADRVRMHGNERMWAGGRVTIDRQTLTASGDSANLDLGSDRGTLMGNPVVRDTGEAQYRLLGRRIAFEMTPDDEIRRVLAQDSADAFGPDWQLRGDTLDLAIDSNKVQRAQAWGRRRRGSAISERNTISADSLDILMPGQLLSLVWGYGRGVAVSPPDSTAPDGEPDWLAGDTLRARFVQRPVTDSATGQERTGTEVRYITAFGKARAYYHTDNEREERGPRGISYSRGRRIDIALDSAKVRTVDIVGLVDGIYLEPMPRAMRDSMSAADSALADSLGRPLPPRDTMRIAPPVITGAADTAAARPVTPVTPAAPAAPAAPVTPAATPPRPTRPAAVPGRPPRRPPPSGPTAAPR